MRDRLETGRRGRTLALHEVLVERKVVTDPVRGTADALERQRPVARVGYHSQVRHVEAYAVLDVLETEALRGQSWFGRRC